MAATHIIPPVKNHRVTVLEPANSAFEFANGILAGFNQLVYGPHLSPAPSRSPSPSLPDSASMLQCEGGHSSSAGEPCPRDQPSSTSTLQERAPPAVLPVAETLTRAEKRKLQEKLRSKENKRRKKEKMEEYQPRDSGHAKKHLAGASHIPTSFEAEKMPISKAGFIALRSPDSATTYRLEDFIGPNAKFNLKLVTWKGE